MQITIEEINGEEYTVVWHNTVMYASFCVLANDSEIDEFCTKDGLRIYGRLHAHIATALPALPRQPKPKHVPLLYRYMAEGIDLYWIDSHGVERNSGTNISTLSLAHDMRIVGAKHSGQRVEIAIEDNQQ